MLGCGACCRCRKRPVLLQPGTLRAHGYEFVSYVNRMENYNMYLARCVPRGEIVSIEQVPLRNTKLNRPFWKWIRHHHALRLLHYFRDDLYAYFVRKDKIVTTVRNAIIADCINYDGNIMRRKEECIQKWSYQVLTSLDYLHDQGFFHNGFDWNAVFLDGKADAHLGGFQNMVHISDKERISVGNLKYCPPEGLRNGFIKQNELEAAESWRFGAHLLEALTLKLICGKHMQQFPGKSKRTPRKRILLKNISDNQSNLSQFLATTDFPDCLQGALVAFLRPNPVDRLTIKQALTEVEWFGEHYFTDSNKVDRVEESASKNRDVSVSNPPCDVASHQTSRTNDAVRSDVGQEQVLPAPICFRTSAPEEGLSTLQPRTEDQRLVDESHWLARHMDILKTAKSIKKRLQEARSNKSVSEPSPSVGVRRQQQPLRVPQPQWQGETNVALGIPKFVAPNDRKNEYNKSVRMGVGAADTQRGETKQPELRPQLVRTPHGRVGWMPVTPTYPKATVVEFPSPVSYKGNYLVHGPGAQQGRAGLSSAASMPYYTHKLLPPTRRRMESEPANFAKTGRSIPLGPLTRPCQLPRPCRADWAPSNSVAITTFPDSSKESTKPYQITRYGKTELESQGGPKEVRAYQIARPCRLRDDQMKGQTVGHREIRGPDANDFKILIRQKH